MEGILKTYVFCVDTFAVLITNCNFLPNAFSTSYDHGTNLWIHKVQVNMCMYPKYTPIKSFKFEY
jgi:hypothetical protein